MYYDEEDKNLDIVVTEKDDTPAMDPKTTPILVLDMWEHAYYVDVSTEFCDLFWCLSFPDGLC